MHFLASLSKAKSPKNIERLLVIFVDSKGTELHSFKMENLPTKPKVKSKIFSRRTSSMRMCFMRSTRDFAFRKLSQTQAMLLVTDPFAQKALLAVFVVHTKLKLNKTLQLLSLPLPKLTKISK